MTVPSQTFRAMLRYEYVLAHRVAVAIVGAHGIRTTCFVATGLPMMNLSCRARFTTVGWVQQFVSFIGLTLSGWLARVLCFHKPRCWVSCCPGMVVVVATTSSLGTRS